MAKQNEHAEEEGGKGDGADGDASESPEPFDTPDPERGSPTDLLRRLMTVGFSGLFTTESAIRGALSDTVPREWVDFIADQSDRTRDEFVTRLAQEFVRVLENVDVVTLAEQMLEGRTIEIKAELKLGPRDEARTQPTPASKSDSEDERS